MVYYAVGSVDDYIKGGYTKKEKVIGENYEMSLLWP